MILVKDNNGKIHQTTDGSIINQSGSINYSTEEQYTGKHWIDGKKIYQKTFIMVLSQASVPSAQDFDCSNVDTILDTVKNNEYFIPALYANTGVLWNIDRHTNKIKAVAQDYQPFTGTFNITIQYTKTTE